MDCLKLISIIVPVYRAEKYLDRCVKSILNQTYINFELILVEDGSPDASGALCDRWAERDNRIRVIHKENGGASSARNRGLDIARGEYIAFVDSDDWIEPQMYEYLYVAMEKSKAQMAICGLRGISSDNMVKKIVQPKPEIFVWERKDLLNVFFRVEGKASCYHICRRLISKELMENYHFIEGRMNEDIETSFYLASKCQRAVYTNLIFYNYYKNYDGVTNSEFSEKKLDLLYIWDILGEKVMALAPEYAKAYEMGCKRARFTLLVQMHLNGYDKNNPMMRTTKLRLREEVRKSFFDLLKWKMPISRKLLLVLACIL